MSPFKWPPQVEPSSGTLPSEVPFKRSHIQAKAQVELLHGDSNSTKASLRELFVVTEELKCEKRVPVRHPKEGSFLKVTHYRW